MRPQCMQRPRDNLQAMLREGVLVRDPAPRYYVYRLRRAHMCRQDWSALASIADYDSSASGKHELTRPDKEDDRVRQIEALNAQTGPVLLGYPARRTWTTCSHRLAMRGRPHWMSWRTTGCGIRSGRYRRATDRALTAPSTRCPLSTSPMDITVRPQLHALRCAPRGEPHHTRTRRL